MKFSKWLLCVLAVCVIIAVVIGLIAIMPSVVTPRYHVSIKSRNMKEWQQIQLGRLGVTIYATVENYENFAVSVTLKFWIHVQSDGKTIEFYKTQTETLGPGNVWSTFCDLWYLYTYKLVGWGVDIVKTEKVSE